MANYRQFMRKADDHGSGMICANVKKDSFQSMGKALEFRDKWGGGAAMEESENNVESLEQLLLYAEEHYLAGKLPLGNHLGSVIHGVEEYHQRNVGPLRFHGSQLKWTGYHRL
ncbi:uncharacterized protein TNCV_256801 [Trichonephila clavipes]|nr:uncharacterized protein TNCV_256801 [Trichonephila clavipes]